MRLVGQPGRGRVLAYIRVSTGRQATEGTSLEGQRTEVERCAASLGLPAPDIRTEVEGAGEERQERRVVLNAILDDLRAGDVLIVPRIDRFSRDTLFTLQAVKRFKQVGAKLISAAENLDPSNDDGYLYLTIHASFAQREKARILERTIGRRRALREAGQRVEGNAPLGYRIEGRRLVVVPEEAELVRYAFAQSIAGQSVRRLREDILARFGKALCPSGMNSLLRNRTYLGETQTWGRQPKPGQPGKRHGSGVWVKTHEPIVDLATFELARQASQRRRKQGRPATSWQTNNWLLRGIARCGVCGAAAYARAYNGKTHDGYYYCRRRMNPDYNEGRCDGGVIERRDVVDANASLVVVAHLEELRAELQRMANAPEEPRKAVDIEGHRQRIQRRREKALEAFEEGIATRDDLRARMAKLDAELADLEARAVKDAKQPTAADHVRVFQRLRTMAQFWDSPRAKAHPEERREVFRLLADRVLVMPGGSVKAVWVDLAELVRSV